MSQALYRRYRPETFDEVIGQEHVTVPLMRGLELGRVNHAYLFSGPRGCGKTTSARILARILNCAENTESHPSARPCGSCESCIELGRGGSGSLDVVEIDAASHGGVDDARDLRERATFSPSRDRFKIFILDEAHMVTPAGFNALLKIVEEPPPYLKFVFATTEPDKVIGTIRSRTHHYPFRLVPPEVLQPYLESVCASEGVTIAPGVLPLVVRAGGGSVRDSLSVLDQLIAGSRDGGIDYDLAVGLLGFTPVTLLDDVVEAVAGADGARLFRVVEHVIATGHEPRRFVEDLLERFRDLLVLAVSGPQGAAVFSSYPVDQVERMMRQSESMGVGQLSRAADVTNGALTEMVGATSPRLHLELLCARLLLPNGEEGLRSVVARVERLEHGELSIGGRPHGDSAGSVPSDEASGAASPASRPGRPAGDGRPEPAERGQESRRPPADQRGSANGRGLANARGADNTPARPNALDEVLAAATQAVAVPPDTTRSSADGGASNAQSEHGGGAEAAAPVARDTASAGTAAAPVARDTASAERADGGVAGATSRDAAAGGAERGDGGATSAETAAHPALEQAAPAAGNERVASGDPSAEAGSQPTVPSSTPAQSSTAAVSSAAGTAPTAEAAKESNVVAVETEVLSRRWDEVMDALGSLRRVTWSLVKQNATVGALRDDELTVLFASQGLLDRFRSGEHAELLSQAIDNALGFRVRVRGDLRGGGPSGPSGGPPAAPHGGRSSDVTTSGVASGPTSQHRQRESAAERPPRGGRASHATEGAGQPEASTRSGAGPSSPRSTARQSLGDEPPLQEPPSWVDEVPPEPDHDVAPGRAGSRETTSAGRTAPSIAGTVRAPAAVVSQAARVSATEQAPAAATPSTLPQVPTAAPAADQTVRARTAIAPEDAPPASAMPQESAPPPGALDDEALANVRPLRAAGAVAEPSSVIQNLPPIPSRPSHADAKVRDIGSAHSARVRGDRQGWSGRLDEDADEVATQNFSAAAEAAWNDRDSVALEDSGLVGAPLIAQVLGGVVIDEIIESERG
ncbi:DNA polymerase III subunit gamma and tau [Rarobacter faecitabidus]|uniref:DNA-directed DNA polymerase n=1 Tax=Rarobacter faecitabidus TaxID=13243 RepID=A0A542ZT85_RARFA|nr:DNA polymerase III subunit gamma and tau [Rarobacter faecitabidus]TQL63572.1 DNA polymerase-3 subunit gamma/tau [Rarobacter faecitabidus]